MGYSMPEPGAGAFAPRRAARGLKWPYAGLGREFCGRFL